jgi:hypothetical protein
MQDMKAAGIHAYGGPEKVLFDVVAPPSAPDATQGLCQVEMTRLNFTAKLWHPDQIA